MNETYRARCGLISLRSDESDVRGNLWCAGHKIRRVCIRPCGHAIFPFAARLGNLSSYMHTQQNIIYKLQGGEILGEEFFPSKF
jgi:hypothetical protein